MKEPDVVVPVGNPAEGKKIFLDQCAACHSMEVTFFIYSG
jgi:mono/diheme cytochrome c family protein